MSVILTGIQLAHAALWAAGATRVQTAESMNVTEQSVQSTRTDIRRKYAAVGISITNAAQLARELAAERPTIKPPRRTGVPPRAPGRRRGRPSTITPDLLAEAQRLRAEGLSFRRIATQLGVGVDAVARAVRRAEART